MKEEKLFPFGKINILNLLDIIVDSSLQYYKNIIFRFPYQLSQSILNLKKIAGILNLTQAILTVCYFF